MFDLVYNTTHPVSCAGWQTALAQVSCQLGELSNQIMTAVPMEYAVRALRFPFLFVLEGHYVQRILWFHYLSFFHHS